MQQRQAKPGWIYSCARCHFRFVSGICDEVRAGFKQHKLKSQHCQMFPVFYAGSYINSSATEKETNPPKTPLSLLCLDGPLRLVPLGHELLLKSSLYT